MQQKFLFKDLSICLFPVVIMFFLYCEKLQIFSLNIFMERNGAFNIRNCTTSSFKGTRDFYKRIVKNFVKNMLFFMSRNYKRCDYL